MSSCPNRNLPEWIALEDAVGRFEAYRDFLETGGEIRTPEEVKQKLEERRLRDINIISKKNIFGVQFHPEKSHDHGLKLLENFIAWNGQR